MEETMHGGFKQDPDITELMELLRHFKDNDGIEKLNRTVEYVDNLENTLSAMMEQITDMKMELQSVREQNEYLMVRADRTVKDVLTEQVAKAEAKVQELHGKLVEIKDSVKQKAHEIVEEAKQKGRKALQKLSDVLHIRDGLHKIREQADQMLEHLDALSVRIDGYQEQNKSKSELGLRDDGKEFLNRRESHEVEGQTDTREAKPVGTYQEEMQTFIENCVAEGREYGSNAEAFEEFKNYYDKKMKAAGYDGMKGKEVMVENKSEKLR